MRATAEPRARERPPRRFRSRVQALGLAALFALLVGELFLRVFGYHPRYANGIAAFHEADPDLGLCGKPDFAGYFNSHEFDVLVELDAHGFRDASPPRTPGRPRLYVLGDSFAWGWGVGGDEMFSARLDRALPELDVVNRALVGTGQVIQYRVFERHVRDELVPGDVVLLALFENDLIDNLGRNMPQWAHARVDGDTVTLVPPPPPSLHLRAKNVVKDTSRVGNLLAFVIDSYQLGRRMAREEVRARERFEHGERIELPADAPERVVLSEFLSRFARDVTAAGATLCVACIPPRFAYGEGLMGPDVPYQEARHRAALATCRELGLPLLDLLPVFRSSKERTPETLLTYPFDFHWSAAGHRTAAEALVPFVRGLRSAD